MAQQEPTRTPDRIAFTVIPRKGGKDFWQRIGAGWLNKDKSITVKLNALPLDGVVVLQMPHDAEAKEKDQS